VAFPTTDCTARLVAARSGWGSAGAVGGGDGRTRGVGFGEGTGSGTWTGGSWQDHGCLGWCICGDRFRVLGWSGLVRAMFFFTEKPSHNQPGIAQRKLYSTRRAFFLARVVRSCSCPSRSRVSMSKLKSGILAEVRGRTGSARWWIIEGDDDGAQSS
jgi:hypothetical protein